LRREDVEFRLGHVEPRSMLWGVMPFEPLHEAARLGRRKRLVIGEAGLVAVEIILHENDLLRVWKVNIGTDP
jgi:hypothetical protein